MKKIYLIAALILTHIVNAQITWTGLGSTNDWSEAANWDSDPVLPSSGDDVIFDGTSVKNCNIDIDVDVNTISLNAGYTGAISGNSQNIRCLGFTMAAGTWNSTDQLFEIAGNFARTGGTFN